MLYHSCQGGQLGLVKLDRLHQLSLTRVKLRHSRGGLFIRCEYHSNPWTRNMPGKNSRKACLDN